MKSLKKISLLAVMCLSLLFVACGNKPSEKDLTECLNGSIQGIAGFDYDYGDVSKTGTKEEYDKSAKAEKQKAYEALKGFGIPFTQEQQDKVYNAVIANTQKIKYEIKFDEITDDTANFTVTSQAIDMTNLSKQLKEKTSEFTNDQNNRGKSKETLYEDLTNIIIDCYNNTTTKDTTTKAVFQKQDNNKWNLTTSPTDLTKVILN